MRFSKNLYKKARRHYVARAQEFLFIREGFGKNRRLSTGKWQETTDAYREAASMARKIVERGNREHGLWKYSVGEK